MTPDRSTSLDFYETHAAEYAARERKIPVARLDAFLARITPAGRVLELGCGAGEDSARMIDRGFDVCPTDGSPAMARQAEARLGRAVAVMRFEELDEIEAFDGVWASACLLHVERTELPGILARIHRALRAGGMFYASFKSGTEEGLDSLGRYYNRPSAEWLTQVFGQAGWRPPEIETTSGSGYDAVPTDWLHVTAVK